MYMKRTTEEVVIEMCVSDLEHTISTRRGIIWDNAFNDEIEFMNELIGTELTTNLLMYTMGLAKLDKPYIEYLDIDISKNNVEDAKITISIELFKKEYGLMWVKYTWENVYDKGNE